MLLSDFAKAVNLPCCLPFYVTSTNDVLHKTSLSRLGSRNASAIPDCFPNSSDSSAHGNKGMGAGMIMGSERLGFLYIYIYIYMKDGLLITLLKSLCPNQKATTFV